MNRVFPVSCGLFVKPIKFVQWKCAHPTHKVLLALLQRISTTARELLFRAGQISLSFSHLETFEHVEHWTEFRMVTVWICFFSVALCCSCSSNHCSSTQSCKFCPFDIYKGARFTCKGGQISCCGWTCRGVALGGGWGEMALLEMVGFFSRAFIYKTSRVPPPVVFQYNPDWMGIHLPRMRIQVKVCDNCEWQSAQLVVSKSCTQMGALSTARLSRWLDNSAFGLPLRFGDKFPIWSNIYCRPIFWFAKTSQNCPTVGVFLFLITTYDNAHCELHVSGPDDMWPPELPLWSLALPKCALVIFVPSQFLRGKYNTKEQGAT